MRGQRGHSFHSSFLLISQVCNNFLVNLLGLLLDVSVLFQHLIIVLFYIVHYVNAFRLHNGNNTNLNSEGKCNSLERKILAMKCEWPLICSSLLACTNCFKLRQYNLLAVGTDPYKMHQSIISGSSMLLLTTMTMAMEINYNYTNAFHAPISLHSICNGVTLIIYLLWHMPLFWLRISWHTLPGSTFCIGCY